ncbi:hypothetical protein [uncultured Psychroserpens sp.]|uniref:hypothetical protein n=1 Tax=uncultured Psychroserpens sp. TaxID=255436 RepID=UPI00261AAEBE|nr:hypothetical protein [uncultured Psychroserpens sp.]
MRSTFFKTSYILLFLFIPIATINGQNHEVNLFTTIFINNSNDNISFFDGTIKLNNNDVLNGRVSINHIKDQKLSVILKSEHKTKYIPNQDIKEVILNNKDGVKTKFITLTNDNKLYREIFSNTNNVTVYDTSKHPFDGRLIGEVLIDNDGTLINTYDFWASGPKQGLINYVSKRDGIKYKRRDFKSLQELFAIL